MKVNKDYLKNELKRIGQKKLIEPREIVNAIDKCIKENFESGRIIRINGDEND